MCSKRAQELPRILLLSILNYITSWKHNHIQFFFNLWSKLLRRFTFRYSYVYIQSTYQNKDCILSHILRYVAALVFNILFVKLRMKTTFWIKYSSRFWYNGVLSSYRSASRSSSLFFRDLNLHEHERKKFLRVWILYFDIPDFVKWWWNANCQIRNHAKTSN